MFAATLEDLIHAEATGQLERIYAALGLPAVGPICMADADSAIHYFALVYLNMGEVIASNKLELETLEVGLPEVYPDYPDTKLWLQGFCQFLRVEAVVAEQPIRGANLGLRRKR